MTEFVGSAAALSDFIWKNAEDLWGNFKHADFAKVIHIHLAFYLVAASGVRS
ncbi:hypothetical protein [Candidatus Liberibacter solanacearum]|uniref:hypothetical protein n=1 Tax=Candidatus Liberibacter solanacearum TaxID=556287 RepID=UPI001AEC755A|nr:hypothetical protein [Candidatus Liberibacter solanacearum]